MSTTPKTKYPAAAAKAVAKELCDILLPCCEMNRAEGRPYLVVAGSLRRRKETVGDVEILYVSKWGEVRTGLLPEHVDLVEHALDELIARGVLEKRTNSRGSEMWGAKNKLARHVASGIPVDFFATRPPFWYNYLVCRTGSADNNTRIATAAQENGLEWHPYHSGFGVADLARVLNRIATTGIHLTRGPLRPELVRTGQMIEAESEADVFALAGLNYLEPKDRS